MDYSRDFDIGQVAVSDVGELVVLEDERFDWRRRKMGTLKLAELYHKAGFFAYEERARTCATWLQYRGDGESRQLSAVNFCQLRLCPMCTARRARRAAYKLSRVLDMVEQERGVMYLFLTLTVRNVDGEHLGDALTQLTSGWSRLMRHRQIERSVKGWFRAIEITRKGKGYHPHIHAILAVEPGYFARGAEQYISHTEWVERWQKAVRADYRPSVRIQTVKGKGEYSGGAAAAIEAAKYTVKDSDYIDPSLPERLAVEILTDYTNALHRRRLTAFGGWMKTAAKELDADNLDAEDVDLVHVDDTVRDDVAELIETYHWHFGAGDYILTEQHVSPLRLRRDA